MSGVLRILGRALRRGPLVALAIAGMAGIVLADRGTPEASTENAVGFFFRVLLFASLAVALVAAGWILRRRSPPCAVLALGALLSLFVFAFLHHSRIESIRAFPFASAMEKGDAVEIEGRGWFCDRPVHGERSTSGILHLESVTVRGTRVACRHRAPVWLSGRTGPFRYGKRFEFTGILRPLESARSPGGFDPSAFYYRESGSLAELEIRPGDRLEPLPGEKGFRIVAAAQRLRDRLEAALLEGVAPGDLPYARLVAAMALGARENSPEDLEEYFRLSGTMHIFAVSGLHVGILAGLLLGALLLAGVPRRYAILILIPLLLFYAVLTGLRPSAIRAAVMLSIFLGAFVVRERPRPLNALAFAALLLLLFDTQQLFLPGFQLSFAVLLSITLFARPVQRWTSGPWLTDPFLPRSLRGRARRMKDRVVTGLTAALAVSLVSWLGSLGLLMWHFQSFSPIGIVANVFLVPLVGVVVSIALASLVAHGVQLIPLSVFFNQLGVSAAFLLTFLAQFFAELPGAHRHAGRGLVEPPPPSALVLDVMGTRGELAVLVGWPRAEPGKDEAAHRYWLIDSGGVHTYQQELLPLLRSRSINRVDALLLTHGDIGHIGAAPRVLTQLRPSLLLEGDGPNRSKVYPEIESIREDQRVRRVVLKAGMRVHPPAADPETTVRILAPLAGAEGRLADDRAAVLRIEQGDTTVLLTSDIGFAVEKALLGQGVDLAADVWIRGQHGESPSGLPAFVRAVDPELVVTTRADFPVSEQLSPEFLAALSETDAELLSLDETGVVTLRLDGSAIEVERHGSDK